MPSYERREYQGNAPATTLAADITSTSTSLTVAASTGWPTGAVGPFHIVLDRGNAGEEKVRVTSRTGTTLTVANTNDRGVDGTVATSHSAGVTVEHVLVARDADEANAHYADTTLDHHTQYLNTARHDTSTRHTFGAALPTPAAPPSIGTANSTGSAAGPARADHSHKLGTGSVTDATVFAAGAVDTNALADKAVTTGKVADGAVGSTQLGTGAVTAGKIAAGGISDPSQFAGSVVTKPAVDATILTPAGSVVAYGGTSAPSGWLMCDGSAVSRTTYSSLFSAIGVTFGAGNGSTTFNLPDLRGRIPMAPDGGTGRTGKNTLGETGGEATHTLTVTEMPSHSHNLNWGTSGTSNWVAGNVGGGSTNPGAGFVQNTGGGGAHNNLQPFIELNYIIKT